MQALRKTEFQTAAMPSSKARDVVQAAEARSADADHAGRSPALQLRDHLAARLDELSQIKAGEDATLTIRSEAKLPMQGRVVTIVGLSMILWLGIYAAVAAIL